MSLNETVGGRAVEGPSARLLCIQKAREYRIIESSRESERIDERFSKPIQTLGRQTASVRQFDIETDLGSGDFPQKTVAERRALQI